MSKNENSNSWLGSLPMSFVLLSFIVALLFPFMLTDLNSMGFENFINYKIILLTLLAIGFISFIMHLIKVSTKKYYGFFESLILFFLILDLFLGIGYLLSDLITELGSKNISDKNINILWKITPYSVGAFVLIDKYLSTMFKTKKDFEKENKEKQKFFMKNTVDLINEMENELKEIKSNFNYYKENNKNNTFKNYKGSLFSLYSSIFIKLNWIFSHNEVKEILNDDDILKIRIEDLIYKLFTDNSYNELSLISSNGINAQKGGLFDSSQMSKEHDFKNKIILEYLEEVEEIELINFNLFDLDKANDHIVNLFNKEDFISLVQNKELKKKFEEIRKLIDFCKKNEIRVCPREITNIVKGSDYFKGLKSRVLNEVRENSVEIKEFENYKKVVIAIRVDGELHNKIYYEKKDGKVSFFIFESNSLFNKELDKNNISTKSLKFKELELELEIKEKELNSENLKEEIIKILED